MMPIQEAQNAESEGSSERARLQVTHSHPNAVAPAPQPAFAGINRIDQDWNPNAIIPVNRSQQDWKKGGRLASEQPGNSQDGRFNPFALEESR